MKQMKERNDGKIFIDAMKKAIANKKARNSLLEFIKMIFKAIKNVGK